PHASALLPYTTLFRASRPATPPGKFVYSAGSHPREGVPSALRSTAILSAAVGSGEIPFALIVVSVAPVLRAIVAPGNDAVASSAATLIARAAMPGADTMYGEGPAFPAAATTIVPARAALFDASTLTSAVVPKSEPRDMLITSMS